MSDGQLVSAPKLSYPFWVSSLSLPVQLFGEDPQHIPLCHTGCMQAPLQLFYGPDVPQLMKQFVSSGPWILDTSAHSRHIIKTHSVAVCALFNVHIMQMEDYRFALWVCKGYQISSPRGLVLTCSPGHCRGRCDMHVC